ncbi:hypothetical protein B0A52_05708 [Exophiala mesophila]|uniref:Transcription factor domain-containing protein n=1 Tax=Exophiala mesophila TaxID=212818 RepID=A0A438N2T8_EXOME|nr:hypothetical protein B0A52_05708 [Exophiala mesophila]
MTSGGSRTVGNGTSHHPNTYDDVKDDDERPSKKARNFIARQVLIAPTLNGNLQSTNEVSMSMMFGTLRRMELKLDRLSSTTQTPPSREDRDSPVTARAQAASPNHAESVRSIPSVLSPQSQSHRQPAVTSKPPSVLSFSAHRTIHWPGVTDCLPSKLVDITAALDRSYPTRFESDRTHLDPTIQPQLGLQAPDWLSTLGLSCVKEVSNAFFDTFNRVYPFIDRDYYFSSTLAQVVREGFGYDIESCLVLNVMALGCMGLKAFEEGGFDMPQRASLSPFVLRVMEEDMSGLSFFNEARRRIGFCLCERDIQSCQYYLTSAVFFAQTMRPVDEWMMTTQAATSCTAFWQCPPEPHDEWLADMHSRLFWSAILLETVIVQELELPASRLKEFEDIVPLPKFTAYPYISKSRARNSDDSYYHYHFLAQIAHRIILSRIRDELFYAKPSPTLADELRHQLEQWRHNLPKTLNYSDDTPDQSFTCPADAVVVALLYTRYRVSLFHLGRPFLFKAIQSPSTLTERDLAMCAESLQYAMDWPLTWDLCAKMKNFMPLKYFASGQMFGQLLIFYAFRHSPDSRLRELVPVEAESWCQRMLTFISEQAVSSPIIANDFKMLSFLYPVDG